MKEGRGSAQNSPAGGPTLHIPVLAHEAVAALAPQPGGVYVDGTFGAGGYTRLILAAHPTCVVAIDRDPTVFSRHAALSANHPERLRFVEGRFSELDRHVRDCGFDRVDGVTLDVGVSSMQLDQAERGFSFRLDGPLDMRMCGSGLSAADLVNHASEECLADILYYYGDERASRRIARAIVRARAQNPIKTTVHLADIVSRSLQQRPGKIHPATRAFQALRIAVNDELEELAQALASAERILKPGGVLAVVTFHSLEDRIVKKFFLDRSGGGQAVSRLLPGEPIPPAPSFIARSKALEPSADEVDQNPRARSAKLRSGRRSDAPEILTPPFHVPPSIVGWRERIGQ